MQVIVINTSLGRDNSGLNSNSLTIIPEERNVTSPTFVLRHHYKVRCDAWENIKKK